nr:MAG TPA: hypothetical protein [Caudoviricetes sp.]
MRVFSKQKIKLWKTQKIFEFGLDFAVKIVYNWGNINFKSK